MADLRKELPPGVKLDSLSRDAREHAKDLLEEYGSWDEIPHFAVDDHEIMVVYIQDHLDEDRVRGILADQRNKVRKFLLEDDEIAAYEDARELEELDIDMAANIFVDDMRLLNRFNEFFGQVHGILDEVEEEMESREDVSDDLIAIDKVRERLKEEFPEDSDELQDVIGSPFED